MRMAPRFRNRHAFTRAGAYRSRLLESRSANLGGREPDDAVLSVCQEGLREWAPRVCRRASRFHPAKPKRVAVGPRDSMNTVKIPQITSVPRMGGA